MKQKKKEMYVILLDLDNKIIDFKPAEKPRCADGKGAITVFTPILSEKQLLRLLPVKTMWHQMDDVGNSLDGGIIDLTADNYTQYILGDSTRPLPKCPE